MNTWTVTGGDDEEEVKNPTDADPVADPGNLDDDIGTRIGEGHDPIEDPVS